MDLSVENLPKMAFSKARFVDQGGISSLAKIRCLKSVFSIAFQYLAIGAVVLFAAELENWLVSVLAVLFIGSRQHALMVLMHEAVHGLLFNSKKWGDFISDVFIAYPIGLSTKLYRSTHLRHHLYTNSDQDPDREFMHQHPDWVFPKSRSAFLKILVKDLSLLNFKKNFVDGPVAKWWSPAPRLFQSKELGGLAVADKILFSCVWAIMLALVIYFGVWKEFLVYWIAPMLFFLPLSTRIRAVVEHWGVEGDEPISSTRTVAKLPFLEKILIAPCNINYHLEHHLFPNVPQYNLPELHERLKAEWAHQKKAVVQHSYFGRDGALNQILKN